MSGHSKWSQIKHKKAITDAKKGRVFSKMVREIAVAARLGGSNPNNNQRLRAALERARSVGLPKENTERAILRASSAEGDTALEDFLYEATAPGGVMILIEGITDNKNRTLAEIKKTVTEHGAKLVPQNSLLWNFEKAWANGSKDYLPKTFAEIDPRDKDGLTPLLDGLAEHDDVQKVYTNLANGS